jgi:hypothetical protein
VEENLDELFAPRARAARGRTVAILVADYFVSPTGIRKGYAAMAVEGRAGIGAVALQKLKVAYELGAVTTLDKVTVYVVTQDSTSLPDMMISSCPLAGRQ